MVSSTSQLNLNVSLLPLPPLLLLPFPPSALSNPSPADYPDPNGKDLPFTAVGVRTQIRGQTFIGFIGSAGERADDLLVAGVWDI